MNRFGLASLCLLGVVFLPRAAAATKSAELYTSTAYGYGRFETRMRVTAGDGIVSAFFLWKDGSEKENTFWNELDYEKVGASCQLQTNALYGNPEVNHNRVESVSGDLCSGFHTYGYEWTADYVAWTLDGKEIRRETGETAAAYAQNASMGMQIHFNVWPGDASFGGNFNPSILPVHQYMDWVQFSSYANGTFTLAWREDFNAATAPTGWLTGDWGSPKNLSTHEPLNVNFLNGCAVISMTADDATGSTGAMTDGCTMGTAGAAGMGTGGAGGMPGGSAGESAGGVPSTGGMGNVAGAGAMSTAGAPSAGGAGGVPSGAGGMMMNGVGGSSGAAPTTGGTTAAGAPGATGSGGTSGSTSTGATGGATSSGGTAPAGGNPTSGGAAGSGGAATGDDAKDGDSSGCGCRVPGSSSPSESSVGATLLLVLAGAIRRRRFTRARGSQS